MIINIHSLNLKDDVADNRLSSGTHAIHSTLAENQYYKELVPQPTDVFCNSSRKGIVKYLPFEKK